MSSETLRWLILSVKLCFGFLFLRHVCGLSSSSTDESLKGNCRTLWYTSKPVEIFQYLHSFTFYVEWIFMITQYSSVTTGTSLWVQQTVWGFVLSMGKSCFSKMSSRVLGPPILLFSLYCDSFLGGKSTNMLTTCLHLLLRLRMSGAVPVLPPYACMICAGWKFPTVKLTL
jgi:hypothetical protein